MCSVAHGNNVLGKNWKFKMTAYPYSYIIYCCIKSVHNIEVFILYTKSIQKDGQRIFLNTVLLCVWHLPGTEMCVHQILRNRVSSLHRSPRNSYMDITHRVLFSDFIYYKKLHLHSSCSSFFPFLFPFI